MTMFLVPRTTIPLGERTLKAYEDPSAGLTISNASIYFQKDSSEETGLAM